MSDNPFNLSQPTLDELDRLSSALMEKQIKIGNNIGPSLKRYMAELRRKADPKKPIPSDTPTSGDFRFEAEVMFHAADMQQMVDLISGKEPAVGMGPANLVDNIRQLLDFKERRGFHEVAFPGYKAIFAEGSPVRAELEAKYAEIHPPEKPGMLDRLLKRGPTKPGDTQGNKKGRGGRGGRGGDEE